MKFLLQRPKYTSGTLDAGTSTRSCPMEADQERTRTLHRWWTGRAIADLTRWPTWKCTLSLKKIQKIESHVCLWDDISKVKYHNSSCIILMNLSLFQYISFTTIGKDPKDPSLVSNKLANTIGGCSHIMSVGKNDRNCSNICLDISPHFRWGAHGTLGAVPLAHSMRPQEVCCLPQHNYPQDQSIRNSSSFSLTSHWSRSKRGGSWQTTPGWVT